MNQAGVARRLEKNEVRKVKHLYSVGDTVIVTGDTADWCHEIEEGHEAVITILMDGLEDGYAYMEYTFDGDPHYYSHGYQVRLKVPPGYVGRSPDDLLWHVAECDLELISPPTEEEMKEVYNSLGVTPTQSTR